MVQEERSPALRRWAPVSGHVLGNRSLADIDAELEQSDIDAELEQFSMNAGSAPERICQAHLADQLPYFEGHLGPAGSSSRLPVPEGAESSIQNRRTGFGWDQLSLFPLCYRVSDRRFLGGHQSPRKDPSSLIREKTLKPVDRLFEEVPRECRDWHGDHSHYEKPHRTCTRLW